jgi:hypothetical protein
MSGSKREFLYTSSSGISFGIIADESSTEAVNGVSAASSTLGIIILPLTKYVRRARYTSSDKLHSAIIPILTRADALAPPPSITVNKANGSGGVLTATLNFRKVYEEKFVSGSNQDSGLNDGDNP